MAAFWRAFIHKKGIFFCTSKLRLGHTCKSLILFTEVKQGEPELATSGALRWRNTVTKNCHNTVGCTSDFNWYPTREDAQKQLNAFLSNKTDTAKFELIELNF